MTRKAPLGLGRPSAEVRGLAFQVLFSLLLGFHDHVVLRHVDDVYVLSAADGL